MQKSTNYASLTPKDGVREILRTGSGGMLALSLVLCSVLTVMRNSAHTAAQTPQVMGTLRIVGVILMSVGAVFACVAGYLPKSASVPAVGMYILVPGGIVLTVCTAAELGIEYGALWTVETILEVIALCAVTAAFMCMAVTSSNVRFFSPIPATIASGACICALIMLLMRITVSFSGVYSVGGQSFIYSQADKYSGQLMWIYATTQPDSASASAVMMAALFERLSLALVFLCMAAFFSGYSKHIPVFSRRLRALDDIPVRPAAMEESKPEPVQRRPKAQQQQLERKTQPQPDSRPEQKTQPQPDPQSESQPEQQVQPSQPDTSPARRSQFRPRSGASEPVSEEKSTQQRSVQQPARQSGFTPRPRREQPAPAQQPKEPAPKVTPVQNPQPQPHTAVRVKVARPAPKPRVQQAPPQKPPMDDDSIWNRYAD